MANIRNIIVIFKQIGIYIIFIFRDAFMRFFGRELEDFKKFLYLCTPQKKKEVV